MKKRLFSQLLCCATIGIAAVSLPATAQEASDLPFKAEVNIEKKNISWTWGIGINAVCNGGDLHEGAAFRDLLEGLAPGVVRLNAQDANRTAFDEAFGEESGEALISTKIDPTHADMMALCNDIDAYYSICVGLKEGSGSVDNPTGNYTVDYIENPETFLHLIEYLAGPSTSTWGAKRAAEGYSDPLLSATTGTGLILEFGNRPWLGGENDAPIGANMEQYAQWCSEMAQTIASSPYWPSIKEKVFLVFGYKNLFGSYTDDAASPYRFLEGVNTIGSPAAFGSNTNYTDDEEHSVTDARYFRLNQSAKKEHLKMIENNIKSNLTESGMQRSYFLNEAQFAAPELFGTVGQAVSLCDFLIASYRYGAIVPAIYNLTEGETRITDEGNPLALYELARLINEHTRGHLVASNVSSDNRLQDENMQPVTDYDVIGQGVFNNGNQWAIALFSRDFDNDYSVKINLPEAISPTANSLKKYAVSGASASDKAFSVDSTLQNGTLTNGMEIDLPAASAVLLVFEATDPLFEALPMGYFDRIEGETISTESEQFAIETNKGKITVTPEILPENTFLKTIIWECTDEAPINASFSTNPEGVLTIRGSGLCSGNGVLNLRGKLAGNPSVVKDIAITISNQGSDCVSIDGTESTGLTIYPNPAGDYFTLSGAEGSTIELYGTDGKLLLREQAYDGRHIDISALNAGSYIVRAGKQTLQLIKQ